MPLEPVREKRASLFPTAKLRRLSRQHRLRPAALGWLIVLSSVAGAVAGADMPDFRLVRSAPPFEVRDYPENQAIEVDVSGERTDAEARGLALISAYLATGLHKSPEAAAAATFPVAEIEASFGWTIHVPLPRELSGSASRPPLGARLRIVTVPAQQVLAVVMSGAPTAADFERARGSLFDFARRQNLTLQTPTWIVVYAPPKTLWFIQRNEVLAPIAPAPEK